MAEYSRTDRAKVRVSPEVAEAVVADIDDAIRRRSVDEIRMFGREAAASGLDQEAARAAEIAAVIESKSARDEPFRIKSVSEPLAPTQTDLVASFDRMVMDSGSAFHTATFEATERARVAEANRQLAAKQQRHEELRARQLAQDDDSPTDSRPWWCR